MVKRSRVLGTDTTMRILGGLYINPDEAFPLREIKALFGEDEVRELAIITELKRLVEAGYVEKLDSDTREPRYRADPRCFIYDQLRDIAVKTFGGHGEIVDALLDDPNIVRAAIFGSFAKGTPTANSDIDLLLVISDPENETFFDTMGRLDKAALRLGRHINASTLTMEEADTRIADSSSSFLSGVLKSPLLPLKGDFDDWQSRL